MGKSEGLELTSRASGNDGESFGPPQAVDLSGRWTITTGPHPDVWLC